MYSQHVQPDVYIMYYLSLHVFAHTHTATRFMIKIMEKDKTFSSYELLLSSAHFITISVSFLAICYLSNGSLAHNIITLPWKLMVLHKINNSHQDTMDDTVPIGIIWLAEELYHKQFFN